MRPRSARSSAVRFSYALAISALSITMAVVSAVTSRIAARVASPSGQRHRNTSPGFVQNWPAPDLIGCGFRSDEFDGGPRRDAPGDHEDSPVAL
jgi:hypothetical protein